MRLFLDSCVVIYYIERRNPWHTPIVSAMDARPADIYCVNDLVGMECRTGALFHDDRGLLGRYDRFFADLLVLPMTPSVFDRAAELRARHRVKTPDALHLATALEHGCDEFWTNDNRLAGATDALAFRSFS